MDTIRARKELLIEEVLGHLRDGDNGFKEAVMLIGHILPNFMSDEDKLETAMGLAAAIKDGNEGALIALKDLNEFDDEGADCIIEKLQSGDDDLISKAIRQMMLILPHHPDDKEKQAEFVAKIAGDIINETEDAFVAMSVLKELDGIAESELNLEIILEHLLSEDDERIKHGVMQIFQILPLDEDEKSRIEIAASIAYAIVHKEEDAEQAKKSIDAISDLVDFQNDGVDGIVAKLQSEDMEVKNTGIRILKLMLPEPKDGSVDINEIIASLAVAIDEGDEDAVEMLRELVGTSFEQELSEDGYQNIINTLVGYEGILIPKSFIDEHYDAFKDGLNFSDIDGEFNPDGTFEAIANKNYIWETFYREILKNIVSDIVIGCAITLQPQEEIEDLIEEFRNKMGEFGIKTMTEEEQEAYIENLQE